MVRIIPFCVLIAYFLVLGCTKEEFIEDASATVTFSTDTLRFDTVFTELGSATRFIKVYNPHNKSIRISKIQLSSGDDSFFRLNIDGIPTNSASDVEIAGEDSLYIFAEVTIDPNQPVSASPFIIEDAIDFEVNGQMQRVQLEAWGQNANYIPNRFNQGGFARLACDFGTVSWDDPKPYVIYGILLIDSCTLRLPPGTQVYVHGGVARQDSIVYNDGLILTQSRGKIISEGTLNNPVTIQGDRLEPAFSDEPGQWAGIRLTAGSKNNQFSFTTIKNAIVGLRVDSLASVQMENCRIYNTASSGLLALRASVEAINCLFYNNSGNSVQLEYGGSYYLDYCTLASFGVDAEALRMGNALCVDQPCSQAVVAPLFARIRNTIIYGSRADEIDLFDWHQGSNPFSFRYSLENCLVRVDELDEADAYPDFFEECDPCINASFGDMIFADPNGDDYHLDSLSIAIEKAKPLADVSYDIEGNARDPQNPDMGCFEWVGE